MIFISYVPPEIVAKAKKIDALTYLQNYEPDELVSVGNGTYTTARYAFVRVTNEKRFMKEAKGSNKNCKRWTKTRT